MPRRTHDSDYRSAFGAALEQQFATKKMQQIDIARAANVSPSYINRLMNGAKVSPEWADLIADTMRLDQAERVKLHTAAARTWGFKLDLTKE